MSSASQAVEKWFGPGFAQLHPLLQQLHRHGGTLSGRVDITYGKGTAGWLGRRVAARLGIPSAAGATPLTVRIHSRDGALHWIRAFGDGAPVVSVFTPVGAWPDGYWTERVGPIELLLGVDTSGGGWRWVPLRMRLAGFALPRWMALTTEAGKRIDDGQYRFSVSVSHPLLGKLFSYCGTLIPQYNVTEI